MISRKKRSGIILLVVCLIVAMMSLSTWATSEDGAIDNETVDVAEQTDDTVTAQSTITDSVTAADVLGATTAEENTSFEIDEQLVAESYASFKGIQLEFEYLGNTEGSTIGYTIYEGDEKKGETSESEFFVSVSDEQKHQYKVHAVINGIESPKYVITAAKTKVYGIKYDCVIRSKCTLECHADGHHHNKTFKAGYAFTAYEFSNGCYKAKVDDHQYSFKRIRLKDNISAKGWYSSKRPYSPEEMTRYVNKRALTSKTNRLVVVSTKSQHLYLFKKSKGAWKIDDDWIISTGSPKTPTPTGLTTIKQKWSIHNGLSWWSACSTFSFHSKASQWKLGKPASGGCIRNTKEQAKYIYDNYKCKTRVCVV